MCALNRRDVLEGLKTLLGSVTEIKTVVRTFVPIDISQYVSTDLPLVEIQEPEEEAEQQMTSRRQMVSMPTDLRIYFLNWGAFPTATYEALVKVIRNKIGSNFTVSNSAVACYVDGVGKIEGEMPLFSFPVSLRLLYYLSELDA